MNFKAVGATDVGKIREANEDAFFLDEENRLFIVADGMGGHQGGGYASKKSLEIVQNELKRLEQSQEMTQPIKAGAGFSLSQLRLARAIQQANLVLFETSIKEPSLRGMGTTLTALLFDENYANLAHIGDSRAYLIRQGKIQQLTEDHSWVQEQVRTGVLTLEEAKNHPLKNIITRSLGHEREIKIDLLKVEYQVKDRFLLCSDGLSNMVSDQEILEVIEQFELEKIPGHLVERANQEGGYDNITIVVVEVIA